MPLLNYRTVDWSNQSHNIKADPMETDDEEEEAVDRTEFQSQMAEDCQSGNLSSSSQSPAVGGLPNRNSPETNPIGQTSALRCSAKIKILAQLDGEKLAKAGTGPASDH
jgi:hypothetical protein